MCVCVCKSWCLNCCSGGAGSRQRDAGKTFFGPFSVQLKKALELNEQLRQRMGVVIVGPSGAGKSTLWRMLRAALSKMGKVVSGTTSFIHCFGLKWENAAKYCPLVKVNYRLKKKEESSTF